MSNIDCKHCGARLGHVHRKGCPMLGGNTICGECGMVCTAAEYHPFAACLMFKACHNSGLVRDSLKAVLDHGRPTTGAARDATE